MQEAEWLFGFLRDETGIPWKPVMEGCWERAHLMCSFIHQAGGMPSKIWALSGARLRTLAGQPVTEPGLRPNIDGLLPMGWSTHVAPKLLVDGPDGMTWMVFDPVVCWDKGPVEKAQWLALLNDPQAKTGESSARVFKYKKYEEVGNDIVLQWLENDSFVEDAEYDDYLETSVKRLRAMAGGQGG
jgi:hypothetical protein